MSARIAPKTDTIGIAFSPHLPRFSRQHGRKQKDGSEKNSPSHDEPQPLNAGASTPETTGALPPETIFEAGLLGNEQALAPPTAYEYIQRLNREWSSPLSTFPLTDKTI